VHFVLCYRQFGVLGPWLISIWFFLNLTAGIIGGYPTTYMAHAGGFLAGMILAFLLLIFKVAKSDDAGQSFLRIITPFLCKSGQYESPELLQETVLVSENRPGIDDRVSFEVAEVESCNKAQHDNKRVFG